MPGYQPTTQSKDPFGDLDALGDAPKPTTAPAKPLSPPAEPDKANSKPTGETKVDHPIDPLDEPAKPEPAKPGEIAPIVYRTSKELREAFTALGSEHKTAKARVAELEQKLAALEASPRDTEAQQSALTETIAKYQKMVDEKEQRLKQIAYEQSDEFREKFETPYNSALAMAQEDVSQLMTTLPDGTTRQSTVQDFEYIRKLPLSEAYTKSKEMFGDAAAEVMSHRKNIERIVRESNAALKKHRDEYATREKEGMARQAQEREAAAAQWRKVNSDLSERFPYFRPTSETDADHDPDANALLKKGFEEADSFFHQRNSLSPQERVILDARIRNQSAAFRPTVHKLKKATARIAELEAKLKEFEKSAPGDPKRTGGGGKVEPEVEDPFSAIDKFTDLK